MVEQLKKYDYILKKALVPSMEWHRVGKTFVNLQYIKDSSLCGGRLTLN